MARRCPICKSKQWRKETGTGRVMCSEGHVLQSYRNETNEADGPTFGLKKLTIKSARRAKAKQSRADPNLYHGARGRFLYFQCLQLLLRKQIAVLVRLWCLPREFESLCRDIWALHLASLPDPPPAEPYLHASGGESEPAPPETDKSGSEREDDGRSSSDSDESGAEKADDKDDVKAMAVDEPPDEPPIDVLGNDDDIEARIQELMDGASDSEEDDDENDELHEDGNDVPGASPKSGQKRRLHAFYHIPASNIAVLVLACWILRIPVMYMDFIKLIDMYTLPYLDVLRHLPESIVKHAARPTEETLSPRFAPRPSLLHVLTRRLAVQLSKGEEIVIPEYNGKPMLWRATRALAGSPTLYDLAKIVGHTCTVPLTLDSGSTPQVPVSLYSNRHKSDNIAPELACVALVIVALKMVYGLDGIERVPRNEEDPATALPVVEDYIEAVKASEQRAKRAREYLFSAKSDASVIEFNEQEIAQYVQFCETALLDRNSQDAAILSTFFPLGSGDDSPSKTADEEGERYSDMEAGGADETSALVPGAMLKVYRGRDVTGLMPADYEAVLSAAATWSGFDADAIAVVVERFERRLVRRDALATGEGEEGLGPTSRE